MGKAKVISYVCGAVIIFGFFLPWWDLGEMGELMSGLAGLAGSEISTTLNGWQLAAGDADMGRESTLVLFAVLPLALVVALRSKAREKILSSFLGLGIIILLSPVPAASASEMGVTGWAIGKLLALTGFFAGIITGLVDSKAS